VGDAGFSLVEVLGALMIIAVLSAVVSPLTRNMLTYARLSGDAHGLANAVAVAKMRASSSFSRARLFVVVSTRSYRIDVLSKTNTWVAEAPAQTLNSGSTFGFGAVTTPPPNTQGTIAQAPLCLDDAKAPITGTACIEFNSRGLPVDSTGTPTGVDAYYVTDGVTVYGINVGATGMMRLWRTPAHATPDWSLQ
jgi:prepilin-type N-terminal cleavage/methylation domain-containing protein